MTDSSLTFNKAGDLTCAAGPDAVAMYRGAVLASSIRLFAKTGIVPTRGVTGPKMLKLATEITGKPYKRGEYTQAAVDLSVWVQTMKAALPHEESGA